MQRVVVVGEQPWWRDFKGFRKRKKVNVLCYYSPPTLFIVVSPTAFSPVKYFKPKMTTAKRTS